MSQDLVQRFLRSTDSHRDRDDTEEIPPDEDPRKIAGNGQILTLGEVAQVLKSMEASMIQHSPEAALSPMLKKTMEYVDHFKKGDEVATLQQMQEACSRYHLSEYEAAMMCNLMPSTVELVKTLLPELKRHEDLTDEKLQSLIDLLKSYIRQ